jgi:iron complex outermembrane receptor protein
LSPTTFPANYYQGDFAFNPTLPNCQPPSSLPTADGACGFDYSAFSDLVPKQTQLSALARGSYAIDKDNTLSLEFLQGNNTLTSNIAATGVAAFGMPTVSPFFPGGSGGTPANTSPDFDPTASIDVVPWRTTAAGNRSSTFENKTDRFMLDWVGSRAGWDYSVAVLQSRSNIKNIFNNGYVNYDNIAAGVSGTPDASGSIPPWLNPFGPQTADGQAYIQAQQIRGLLQRSEGTLRGVKADASTEVYKLPAGPLTMAGGIEYYRDSVSIANDLDRIAQAAGSGLEGAFDSFGSRNWLGLFMEFNVPVVKDLELNLALRYDNYSDFGSTTNPKAALRWTPTKELLVRGSVNTGFRAPSLYDVYSPPQLTFLGGPQSDPVLCPGGNVDTAAGGIEQRDCNNFDYQQTLGGNQQLDPESSTAWSVGLVFQPDRSLLLSVDYWNYAVDESIGNVGEDAIFADPVKYANRIIRCSQLQTGQAGNFPVCGMGTTGDPIAYIDNTKTNLGTYKTSGLDFAANWRSQPMSYGRFMVGWQATYVLNYEYQQEAGGVYNNNLGTFFNLQAISRYRQVLNLGWQQDAWTVNLINRYARGYNDQNFVDPAYYNRVGSINTWDLAATWTGLKNAVVTAGITNLFNQDPPFSNQQTGPPTGYDYRYASPIGRAFILRALYRF